MGDVRDRRLWFICLEICVQDRTGRDPSAQPIRSIEESVYDVEVRTRDGFFNAALPLVVNTFEREPFRIEVRLCGRPPESAKTGRFR